MVKAAFTFLQPPGLLGQVSQRRLNQRDAKVGQNGSLTSHFWESRAPVPLGNVCGETALLIPPICAESVFKKCLEQGNGVGRGSLTTNLLGYLGLLRAMLQAVWRGAF